jgi:hypothetical protein
MSVCCECCVLSGRGLCVGLIIRPEESYRLCECVWVRSLGLTMRKPYSSSLYCAMGRNSQSKKTAVPLCEWRNFCWHLSPPCLASLVPSTCYLVYYLDSQVPNSLLTDPCPCFLRSHFLAVILLILTAMCRWGRRSAGKTISRQDDHLARRSAGKTISRQDDQLARRSAGKTIS